MTNKRQHINEEHQLPKEWEEIAGKAQPVFKRSKEEVWSELMSEIGEEKIEAKVIQMNWPRLAAAAVITVLLSSVGFMRFYTESTSTPAGQHASIVLPDGSTVELNAASEISFHPYWWRFSRDVEFEGEAFFKVEKGSAFRVVSETGSTEVLGTSFNINSRDNGYEVYCKTGKVGVSNESSSVVLEPNQFAVAEAGSLTKSAVQSDDEFVGWVDNRFVFNGVPLNRVIQEIEIQYDISISSAQSSISELVFTGSFEQSENVNQTLEIVGNSMGVKFEQTAIGKYSVKKS